MHRKYEKIINNLKANLSESQKFPVAQKSDEKENIQKVMNMSEEKAKMLLIKLDKFVITSYSIHYTKLYDSLKGPWDYWLR